MIDMAVSVFGHFIISNIESIQIKLDFPNLLDHEQYLKCLKNLRSGHFFRDFDPLGLGQCSGISIFSKHPRRVSGLHKFEKHAAEQSPESLHSQKRSEHVELS